MRNKTLCSAFLLAFGLLVVSIRPAEAQTAGDRIFDTARVHTINVVFNKPWSEVEPTLKTNKEAEIYIPAQLELNCLPPDTSGCVRMDSVGVRFKGNSTYSASRQKNPFRFSFDEYGIDQRWDGLKGFVLNNGWNDASFIREKLHYDFARRAGIPGPRGTHVWLYVNGERYAFYLMVELVDKRFLESRFRDKDGDRFKATDIIGSNKRSDFTRRSPYTPAAYYGYYEANSDDTTRAWQRMAQFIDGVNVTSEDSIATVFPSIVNVDDLYRGIGADILLGNTDNYMGPGQNFNTYFPSAGGAMRWIIWDVSLSFSSSQSNAAFVRTVLSRPLTNRFMTNEGLKQDYLRALWFMYRAHLADDWIMARIDSLQTVVMAHTALDTRRLSTVTSSAFTSLKSQITSRRTFAEGSSGFAASTININAGNAIRAGDVALNELSPSQGWVELYNARDYSIDLSGHSLTNDAANPNKWTFPARSFVAPRSHLVVRMQGGPLGSSGPTNFALSAGGGHLRLTRASGSVVDSITYPARSGDSTIARAGDGSGAFGIGFPTPGSTNVASSVGTVPLSVVINEFMADNDTILAPAGVKADWVELFNTTASSIDLSGMHLSDNPNNPAKWSFPSGASIAAGGYLIVWAYDTTFAGSLHASWALSKDGEHIRLSNANQTVVDSVTFGPQPKNRTMARVPNGTGAFAANSLPTLGASNGNGTSIASRADAARLDLKLSPALAQVRLASAGKARLIVLDARGRTAAVLMDGSFSAGMHTVRFDPMQLPAGAYLFRLESEGRVLTRTAVVLK